MAGFEVVEVSTDDRGMVNIDDLKNLVDENTAGLMLTNPNTGEEIVIEKIPIDITLRGSFLNFNKFLENLEYSEKLLAVEWASSLRRIKKI